MPGLDFAALPPEVNSARMYTGPGAAPMLAAAASWRALAADLGTAASAYQAVIEDLTGQAWLGAASAAMAAAATPYADWLGTTATVAEHTADRLMLAAGAFEQAFAATVPPPVIAVNRTRLAALVADNVLGQNAAAIAATEAEYGQMWLQDATVMYGYAARSAAATALTPLTAPPRVADPAGTAGQAAAGLAQAAPPDPVAQAASYIETVARSILPANDTNISALYGMGQYARNLNTDLDISQATGGRAGFGSGTRVLAPPEPAAPGGSARPAVAASAGRAGVVGKLAVPPAWTESISEVTTTVNAGTTSPPAAAVAPAGSAAHGAGAAAAGLAGRRGRRSGRTEARIERTAGELTGISEVRHWHVEPGELKGVLGEVAAQPGVHEVYFGTDEPPGSCGGPSFGSPSSSLAEPPAGG